VIILIDNHTDHPEGVAFTYLGNREMKINNADPGGYCKLGSTRVFANSVHQVTQGDEGFHEREYCYHDADPPVVWQFRSWLAGTETKLKRSLGANEMTDGWITTRPPTQADTDNGSGNCVEVTYKTGIMGWEPYWELRAWNQWDASSAVAWRRIRPAWTEGP